MRPRYHANTAAGAGAAALTSWAASLPAALAEAKAAVLSAAPEVHSPSVYTGAAGVAYALARAARSDASLMPAAARLAAAAAARPDLRRRVPESVMDGQAGVALVHAVVARCAAATHPACARRCGDGGIGCAALGSGMFDFGTRACCWRGARFHSLRQAAGRARPQPGGQRCQHQNDCPHALAVLPVTRLPSKRPTARWRALGRAAPARRPPTPAYRTRCFTAAAVGGTRDGRGCI